MLTEEEEYKLPVPHDLRPRSIQYLRTTYLGFPVPQEDEFALRNRMNSTVGHLQLNRKWKDVKKILEEEAFSKVAVGEHLGKLHKIARELSVSSMTVDDLALLLLTLFIQEPITDKQGKSQLTQVMKHVCERPVQFSILHRIQKVVNEIEHIIPPYTHEYFEKPFEEERSERFGSEIKFISLDRSKIEWPDTSKLNNILLEEYTGSESTDNEKSKNCRPTYSNTLPVPVPKRSLLCIHKDSEESGACTFTELENPSRPNFELLCDHKEDNYFEELNLRLVPTKLKKRTVCLPLSHVNDVCKIAFREKLFFNEIESAIHEPLFKSDKNILINVPLGFKKDNIVALAVLSLVGRFNSINLQPPKALYLASSKAAAENVAEVLKMRLAPLKMKILCFTNISSVVKTDFKNANVVISTPEVWGMFAQNVIDDSINSFQMLVIDNLNCIADSCGQALETVIARMSSQIDCDSPLRIIAFTISLLKLNSSACFSDLARFLKVEEKCTFLYSHQANTLLPEVALIGVKTEDSDSCVTNNCISHVNNAIYHDKKVIVCVSSEEEAIETAKALKTITYRRLKNRLLSDKAKKTMLKILTDGNASESYKKLCTTGYIVLSSRTTCNIRNFLTSLFKKGMANLIVTTPDFASLFANQADIVFIKGTDIFNETTGRFVDMGICALTDLFTAATRFPCSDMRQPPGNVIIAVENNKFGHYSRLLQNNLTIESQVLDSLPDLLNAEITHGGISDITGCVKWFKCTFLYQNMQRRSAEIREEKNLNDQVVGLIVQTLQTLELAGMVRFLHGDNFVSTERAHIASQYCIPYSTMEYFNNEKNILNVSTIIDKLYQAPMFSDFSVHEDEFEELQNLAAQFANGVPSDENNRSAWMVNVLFRTHLLGGCGSSKKIVLAQKFVAQRMRSASRALLEVFLCKKNALMTKRCLEVAHMVEESFKLSEERMSEETPKVDLTAYPQVISRSVIQVNFWITPQFKWSEEKHGKSSLKFWLWTEDTKNNFIGGHCSFVLNKEVVDNSVSIQLSLPMAQQSTIFTVYIVNKNDLTLTSVSSVNFENTSLPSDQREYTDLVQLKALHVSALANTALEKLYSVQHFSPEITQSFHSLYQNDSNILFSSSLSRNRHIAAELSIFRAMLNYPASKVVYLTPWDIEVSERTLNWQTRFKELGWKVIQFSGKVVEDVEHFLDCDIAIATAENWELACRKEEIQRFLLEGKLSLVIVDELQVMSASMECAISRLMSLTNSKKVRVVGMSQSNISCVKDVAAFLGVSVDSQSEFYHFKCLTSNEPVPKVSILGFIQELYDLRMKAMTFELWKSIKDDLKSNQLVTVLTTSEKEVLATALTLKKIIKLHRAEYSTNFINADGVELNLQDQIVAECLQCGIGFLHSGMSKSDYHTVQTFCFLQRIRVLILHIDIAHTIRLKSKLLFVKGTETLSDTTENLTDIPVPELINKMYACCSCLRRVVILAPESKKRLLWSYFEEGLLVDTQLLPVLPEFLNNEIASKNIENSNKAEEYLSHSLLALRLSSNPHYLDSLQINDTSGCSFLVEKALASLQKAGCIIVDDSSKIQPTILGVLSSVFGLSHKTMKQLDLTLKSTMTLSEIMIEVCCVEEFKQIPMRIQDNETVKELKKKSRWQLNRTGLSPLVMKVFYMLQTHFSGRNSHTGTIGYESDMKQIVCYAHRIMQAVVELFSSKHWLRSTLRAQLLVQMIVTGNWGSGMDPIFSLPHINRSNCNLLFSKRKNEPKTLPEVQALYCDDKASLFSVLEHSLQKEQVNEVYRELIKIPVLNVELGIRGVKRDRLWIVKPLLEPVYVGQGPILYEHKRYFLSVTLKDAKAEQKHSWTLILGCQKEGKLVLMKRVKSGETESVLPLSSSYEGRMTYTLYVMADSFVGIDQQYDFKCVYVK